MARGVTPLTVSIYLVCLAGCGGGSKPAATATRTTASTPQQTTPTPAGAVTADTVTTGPVRATLRGAGHTPVVGKHWVYTVSVTDAAGHPLDGSVTSEFAFAGQVVGREAPPVHQLKAGRLHDVIEFPARAVGVPLLFQTVVHTASGNVVLSWPVSVTP
jgi:hypothetical protein